MSNSLTVIVKSIYKEYNPDFSPLIGPEDITVPSSHRRNTLEKIYLEDACSLGGFAQALGLAIITLGFAPLIAICSIIINDYRNIEDKKNAILDMGVRPNLLKELCHLPAEDMKAIKHVMAALDRDETATKIDELANTTNRIVLYSERTTFGHYEATASAQGIDLTINGFTAQLNTLDEYKEARTPSYKETQKSIGTITTYLSDAAKKVFSPLINLESLGTVDKTSPIVSGDLDGSTVRHVLFGIQAGIIKIDTEGEKILAWLMNEEARTLMRLNSSSGSADDLLQFQGNKKIQQRIADLSKCLTYQTGHAPLIITGDFMHDRFSCNKDIDRVIRENMHEHGVIFVAGNHDVYKQKCSMDFQYGVKAIDTGSWQDWKTHQDKILCNAYYHQPTNTLYLHHGIQQLKEENTIRTAFGDIRINSMDDFDPHNLVQEINKFVRPLPIESFKEQSEAQIEAKRHIQFCSFRPGDGQMNRLAQNLNINVVHGHDSSTKILSNVVNVNARSNEQFAIVGYRIGLRSPVPVLSVA